MVTRFPLVKLLCKEQCGGGTVMKIYAMLFQTSWSRADGGQGRAAALIGARPTLGTAAGSKTAAALEPEPMADRFLGFADISAGAHPDRGMALVASVSGVAGYGTGALMPLVLVPP
jgi:hypothetical protein